MIYYSLHGVYKNECSEIMTEAATQQENNPFAKVTN